MKSFQLPGNYTFLFEISSVSQITRFSTWLSCPALGLSPPRAASISSSLSLQLLLSAPSLDPPPSRDWQHSFIRDWSHTASKSISPAVLCSFPSCTTTPNGSDTSWVRELTGLKPGVFWGGLASCLLSMPIHLSSCMGKSTSTGQTPGKPS